MSIATVSVNSNTTISFNYRYYLADASAGSITLTLPTINNDGQNVTIRRTDTTSANSVTVTGTGGQLINGAATVTIPINGTISLTSIGTAWQFINQLRLKTIFDFNSNGANITAGNSGRFLSYAVNPTNTEANTQLAATSDGTLQNLVAVLSVAQPAGANGFSFTVRKNGVNTALTTSVTNGGTTNVSNGTVSVNRFDLLSVQFLQVGAGTNTNGYVSFEMV